MLAMLHWLHCRSNPSSLSEKARLQLLRAIGVAVVKKGSMFPTMELMLRHARECHRSLPETMARKFDRCVVPLNGCVDLSQLLGHEEKSDDSHWRSAR